MIYARRFGFSDLETCEPVTSSTLFYLLSVTKPFTGKAAALLHEEGVLNLDKPLPEIFEGLTLPAPLNPAQISVRDFLLHGLGFSANGIGYRTFAPGNLDHEGILEHLKHHAEPSFTEFDYDNLGYILTGAAMREATGTPWEELLEEKVFRPVGMAKSTTSIERAKAGDFAYPYVATEDGAFDARPVKVQPQMHAAGG